MTEPDAPHRPLVANPGLTGSAIRAAALSIPDALRATPQFVHDGLSALAGCPIVVKVESATPLGSFKGRGTWLAIHGLVARGEVARDRPVVVASSGNFGQGVAYAARAAGVPAVVFCDAHGNPSKLERIRRLGADLRLVGRDFDEAREAAAAYADAGRYALLVDGEDVAVATGAGTIALEVTDAVDRGALPAIANAYVPVGNGALIVGIGAWFRERGDACRIVGVQAAGAPSMERSWRAGRVVETETAATYAEGIATRVPVPEAVAQLDGRVDEMLLVDEAALHAAQAVLTAELGVTAEGSAAASWAGFIADRGRTPGACLIVLTGSNVAAS